MGPRPVRPVSFAKRKSGDGHLYMRTRRGPSASRGEGPGTEPPPRPRRAPTAGRVAGTPRQAPRLSGPVRSAFCGRPRKPAHPVLNKPRNPKRQPCLLVAVCAHHVEEPFFNQRPMSGSPRVAPGIINSESVSTARRLHAYACPRIIAGLLGYFPGRANWTP